MLFRLIVFFPFYLAPHALNEKPFKNSSTSLKINKLYFILSSLNRDLAEATRVPAPDFSGKDVVISGSR